MKYSAKPEILNDDNDAQLAWSAIEPIWDDLQPGPFKRLERFLSDLTEGQQALIAIDWCQKEIRNGGISQLFENTTGNLLPWALDGFRLIGANRYAELLSEAAEMLGPVYPSSGSARKEAYRSLSDLQRARIDELETAFFQLIDSEEEGLEKLRASYVRMNPKSFINS